MNQKELQKCLVPIGAPLIPGREATVKAIASRHKFINFKDNSDWHVPIVELDSDGSEDRYVSDVCMSLYREYNNAPFSACYLPSSQTWSLRSDKHGNNTDVGAIAKSFGGGGHHNASGFSTKEL